MNATPQSLAGPQSRLRCGWIALALVTMWPSGCGRYVMGTQTLYPPDIKTVYVQMFDSTSFRRGLGERLTEAIVKEIESRTPYKVVNSPDADSVLTGRIVNDNKGNLVNAAHRRAALPAEQHAGRSQLGRSQGELAAERTIRSFAPVDDHGRRQFQFRSGNRHVGHHRPTGGYRLASPNRSFR